MTSGGATLRLDIAGLLTTAVAAVGDDGRLVYLNDAFRDMFAAVVPAVGRVIFDGSEPRHNAPLVEALRATMADGRPRVVRNASEGIGRVFENNLTRRDGITVIETRDVTADAREAADRRRLESARALTWARSDAYFMLVDVLGGHVVASEKLSGSWPVSELETIVAAGRVLDGLTSAKSYRDPWAGPQSASDGRVLRAVAEVFTTGQEQHHRTVVPLTADDVRHLDVAWVPWVVDGTIHGAIMVGHDVTGQVRAEQREMVAAATMHTLLNRLPVTLWQIDLSDRLAWPLFADRRERPDPEWGQHEPLATTFDFLAPESVERLSAVVDAIAGHELQTLTVSSADRQHWMQLSLSLLDPDAQVGGVQVLVVATDVTDELAEAEADRRMDHAAHVMRFAQGVAHDFGNVAQVIGGYSEMLVQNQDPVVLEQASKRLRSAAMRAVDVSRRIARIARVQQVVNGPVDISDLVASQVSELTEQLGPEVHVTVAVEPHLFAYAEQLQVRSAVENLCHNAAEAMDGRGHVHLAVAAVTERGRRYVDVTVGDDGPGIPADIVDRVFDPFVTGRPNIGTGLGLYLIQEYLYSVGGFVMAENTSPGALFRMRFQAAREGFDEGGVDRRIVDVLS